MGSWRDLRTSREGSFPIFLPAFLLSIPLYCAVFPTPVSGRNSVTNAGWKVPQEAGSWYPACPQQPLTFRGSDLQGGSKPSLRLVPHLVQSVGVGVSAAAFLAHSCREGKIPGVCCSPQVLHVCPFPLQSHVRPPHRLTRHCNSDGESWARDPL